VADGTDAGSVLEDEPVAGGDVVQFVEPLEHRGTHVGQDESAGVQFITVCAQGGVVEVVAGRLV